MLAPVHRECQVLKPSPASRHANNYQKSASYPPSCYPSHTVHPEVKELPEVEDLTTAEDNAYILPLYFLPIFGISLRSQMQDHSYLA